MRFYHFKGGEQFEFEAHIFAPDDQRAVELFFIQSLMNEQSDYTESYLARARPQRV